MNILEIKKAYFEGILTKEQVEKCLFVIDSISLLDEALTLKNKENISLNKAISKIKKRYRRWKNAKKDNWLWKKI